MQINLKQETLKQNTLNQTILTHCTAVIRKVTFIGFGVQIILGILWMCNAFAGLHSPGKGIVCVGEIVSFSAAVYFVLGSVRKLERWKSCFVILSVITFPMIMQCLVTVDTRVPAAALLLAEVGCILRELCPGEQERRWWFPALGAGCWLAAGLLRGEYLWIGMIPMLFYILLERDVARQGIIFVWRRVLLTLAVAGLIVGIGSFYRSPADAMTVLADRVAWTSLYTSYNELPQEYRWKIKYHELIECSYEATGVEEVLVPFLMEKRGEETTRLFLKELIAVAWRDNRNKIVKEIVWDFAGYTLPELIVPMQLKGRAYESYTGINYRQILQTAPRLGKIYMDFGCWWFVAALVLRMAVWVFAERDVRWRNLFLIGLTALFCALWYTMIGAGKMDYKNTLFVICVWIIWMASTMSEYDESSRRDRHGEE